MFSFFVTVLKFLEAIRRAAGDKGFRAAAFMTLVLLLMGTYFYSHAED